MVLSAFYVVPTMAPAEVMDKEPALSEVWVLAVIVTAIAFDILPSSSAILSSVAWILV